MPTLMLCLVIGGALCACTSTGRQPAYEAAFDPDRSAAQRTHAIGLISDEQVDDLFELVQSARHPIEVREAAVDRLIDHDAEAFWRRVDVHLVSIDDWPMVRLLCEQARVDHVTSFVPIAIKSWARPSIWIADPDRPERQAIQELIQGVSPESVLEAWVLDTPDRHHDRTAAEVQDAAWIILARQLPDQSLRSIVQQGGAGHPLLGPYSTLAPAVDRLPGDRESMRRVESLVQVSTQPQWQERAAFRDRARREDRVVGVELRHLPAIDHGGNWGRLTRQELLEELHLRLAGRTHYQRGVDAGSRFIEQRPEQLSDHAESLSRGDLLVLIQIDQALAREDFPKALFAQAAADLADSTTEYGGVLTWDSSNGQLSPQSFPPLLRRNDQIYIASDDCVRAMHTGLAHYHFHAMQHDSAAWAGPGGGDRQFAAKLQANCAVFTFIDPHTLNVDVYFPGGEVVDLGAITSP